MERLTEFRAAYDHTDKRGGIHGVTLMMIVKGELGAVTFQVYTGWMLPETVGITDEVPGREGNWGFAYRRGMEKHASHYPMPTDLGYHSKVAKYDDQYSRDDCPWVDGPCFYDGSSINCERPFDALLRGGHEAVFEYLEAYYKATLEGEEE